MNDTKKTLEDELRSRGIPPPEKCNCVAHVAISLLIATIAFAIFWELT